MHAVSPTRLERLACFRNINWHVTDNLGRRPDRRRCGCHLWQLTLRERHAFTIYATSRSHQILDTNPIFEALARDINARQDLPMSPPKLLAAIDAAG